MTTAAKIINESPGRKRDIKPSSVKGLLRRHGIEPHQENSRVLLIDEEVLVELIASGKLREPGRPRK